MGFIRAGGFNMFVLLALGAFAIPTAVRFARVADPHRLSLLRALTWAIWFSAFIGFVSCVATCALKVGRDPALIADPLPALLVGFAESCANLILGGGIAAVVWILIAVGIRRMPQDHL